LHLYFIGKRIYSTTLGRWLTPDPAGFIDGPNLYTYAHNRPLTLNDLMGLLAEPSQINEHEFLEADPHYQSGQCDGLRDTLYHPIQNGRDLYNGRSPGREYIIRYRQTITRVDPAEIHRQHNQKEDEEEAEVRRRYELGYHAGCASCYMWQGLAVFAGGAAAFSSTSARVVASGAGGAVAWGCKVIQRAAVKSAGARVVSKVAANPTTVSNGSKAIAKVGAKASAKLPDGFMKCSRKKNTGLLVITHVQGKEVM
jgi:hypothetical protein